MSPKTQNPPLNAWVIYRLRYIFAADILGSRGGFGGLGSHPDYFASALYIATTETIDAAIAFDSLLFGHIEGLSRSREELSAGIPDIAANSPTENPAFKLRAVSQTA